MIFGLGGGIDGHCLYLMYLFTGQSVGVVYESSCQRVKLVVGTVALLHVGVAPSIQRTDATSVESGVTMPGIAIGTAGEGM